jgi:hypothetical protein
LQPTVTLKAGGTGAGLPGRRLVLTPVRRHSTNPHAPITTSLAQ